MADAEIVGSRVPDLPPDRLEDHAGEWGPANALCGYVGAQYHQFPGGVDRQQRMAVMGANRVLFVSRSDSPGRDGCVDYRITEPTDSGEVSLTITRSDQCTQVTAARLTLDDTQTTALRGVELSAAACGALDVLANGHVMSIESAIELRQRHPCVVIEGPEAERYRRRVEDVLKAHVADDVYKDHKGEQHILGFDVPSYAPSNRWGWMLWDKAYTIIYPSDDSTAKLPGVTGRVFNTYFRLRSRFPPRGVPNDYDHRAVWVTAVYEYGSGYCLATEVAFCKLLGEESFELIPLRPEERGAVWEIFQEQFTPEFLFKAWGY